MIVTIILCIHYVASTQVCIYTCIQVIINISCQSSSNTIISPEVYQMEGFSNWIKIERMVSNYFCSCNLEQLKMSLKKSGKRTYMHTYTHMHTRMHIHVHIHLYTICILTYCTIAMVRKTRCPLAK